MATLHTDEIPLSVDTVRAMVDTHLPEYAELPLSPLSASGSTNALCRLGDNLLVRVPRQPGGSGSITKEARWGSFVAPHLPVAVPDVVAVVDADRLYPERWSVVRWIEGEHPAVITPDTPPDPRRDALARDLAGFITALRDIDIPEHAQHDPHLRGYRARSLQHLDATTRDNLARCRELPDFGFDTEAAEQIWDTAMELPEVAGPPRWAHVDLAAENLLVRDGRLAAVLDFGGLSIGDPTVDLIVAWEVLAPRSREVFRRELDIDDATWLRGRAWALGISLMIWYYWTTMPTRRARAITVGRNVLLDAGYA